MFDKEKMCDLAFELRATERQIEGIYALLKEEKDRRAEILKQMDKLVDRAVEQARKGE